MAPNASGAARCIQWLIFLFRPIVQFAAYTLSLLFGFVFLVNESSPVNAAAIPHSAETIASTQATENIGESSTNEGEMDAVSLPLNDRVMTWWRTSHEELRRKEAANRGHRRETRNFFGDRHHSGDRLPTVASGEALDCAVFSAELRRTNAATVRSSPSCSECLTDLNNDVAVDALVDAPPSTRHDAADAHPRLRIGRDNEHSSSVNVHSRSKSCSSPPGVLDIDSVGASSRAESTSSPDSDGVVIDTKPTRQNDRTIRAPAFAPPLPTPAGEQLDWRNSSDEEPLFF